MFNETEIKQSCYQRPSSGHKMHQIRFRPGRWVSSRRSPRSPSRLGPLPIPLPSAPRFSRLWCSYRRLRRLASSVPPLLFSQFNHCQCDARPTVTLPAARQASPPIGWYQIILLGDRGTCVLTACPGLHSIVERPGFELATY